MNIERERTKKAIKENENVNKRKKNNQFTIKFFGKKKQKIKHEKSPKRRWK